jgi:RNA polymerase primary sigma factor
MEEHVIEDSYSFLDKDDVEFLTPAEFADLEEETREALEDEVEDLESLDSILLYKRDISKYPLLTHEQEIELAIAIEEGLMARNMLNCLSNSKRIINFGEKERLESIIRKAETSRETLVNSNARLVISRANKFRYSGLPLEDLIQEGNIGLLKAVEKFDYTKGWKFSTYATWWIMHDVRQAAYEKSTTIKVTIAIHEKIRDMLCARDTFFQKFHKFPTNSELAKELDMTEARVRLFLLRYSLTNPIEIDRPVNENEEETLGDFIEIDNEDLNTTIIENAANDLIEKALHDVKEKRESMAKRNRELLKYITGALDGQNHTFKEGAEKYGVTRERVRQITKRLKRKVREGQYADNLKQLLSAFDHLES